MTVRADRYDCQICFARYWVVEGIRPAYCPHCGIPVLMDGPVTSAAYEPDTRPERDR
jgi:DNA-directed RNA polymerase subunit RPC12/RpoP